MTTLDLRQVRAIVTDAEVLGRLDPATVAAYLERTGWVRAHERADGAIWARRLNDSAIKVFVPSDPAVADFALRMGALLGALSVAEDRSQLAVLAELCWATTPAPADAERMEPVAADQTWAFAAEAQQALRWRTERARISSTAPLPFLTVAQADAILAALAAAPADGAEGGHVRPEATT